MALILRYSDCDHGITNSYHRPHIKGDTEMLGTHILLYTDPGTGALIWQLFAAAIFGAAFYFRQYLSKIKVTYSAWKHKTSMKQR